ncbi:hypothetical protein QQZ08_010249 [Neonectria magnoliae]|uniref:Uncharacterized protein n=1 Tax=Neonectria magnoliae TaxID=2732573 RepID=A0ABR1HI35_9HYPO
MSSKTELKNIHQTTYPAISPKRPELSTKGKNALITGGASGIGAAISKSFAESGIANLAILGRTEKTLQERKKQIESLYPKTTVWIYAVDIVNGAATASAVKSYATSIHGKIDILIANAGYLADPGSVTESDPKDWWLGFEVSVRGNFNLLRAFQPVAAEQATVIQISTAAVHLPYLEGHSSYRASKIAAHKMFEYYQGENPSFTVIQIHPGLIAGTEITKKLGASIEELGLAYDDADLSGDFAVWAASKEAKFLNGRFVWATWDIDELKAMKAELAADKTRFTLGVYN